MRKGEPWLTASADGHRLDRDATPQRRRRRGQGVGDLVHAVHRQPDIGVPPWRRQAEPCPQLLVEDDAVGPDVGLEPPAEPEHRAGAGRRHGPDQGVVDVEDARPDAGRAATSSPLAAGHAVEVTEVLHVGLGDPGHDADVGAATSASRWMCPTPRAPISSTTHCAPSGALSRVSGRPSSLLKEPSLAAMRNVDARQPARRSLVVVLPTDPVMPMAPPTRPRANAPRRQQRGGGVVDTDGRPAHRLLVR